MAWDSTFKPRLRPLEAFRLEDAGDLVVGVRDRTGLSDIVLSVSEPALHLMSMIDGDRTCDDIRNNFPAAAGAPLRLETLHSLLDHLEQAHFLEGFAFDRFYDTLQAEYRGKSARPMAHTTDASGNGGLASLFEDVLKEAEISAPSAPVRGIIAPHLDYVRGRPCYGAAYGALRERAAPDRVVILGTNHFGRSPSAVATCSPFATPLGVTQVDLDFLGALEARCGGLRKYELDHAREHSIELQVALLQHLFGATQFRIVPVLCPDPCGPTGSKPHEGDGVDLRDFASILGELAGKDNGKTLLIAGADLSHVGAAFGDEQILDGAFLEEVRSQDERIIERVRHGDAEGFRALLAENSNPTRVCSAGCIFALTTALSDASPALLGYHQAVDESSQTCVTCTAVVFT